MLSVRVFGLEFYERTMCECECDCKRMFIFIILKLIYRGMEFQRIDSHFKISQVCIQLVTQNIQIRAKWHVYETREYSRKCLYFDEINSVTNVSLVTLFIKIGVCFFLQQEHPYESVGIFRISF